jgi:hypothetical protein
MGKDRNGHRKGTIMATAQHPVPTRTAVHHDFDWLWIGLSVILVALIAGAVAWVIFRPAVTVPPLPAEVIGFEYSQEATPGMAVQRGVTGEYFGYSGELYPEVAAVHITDPGEAASLIRSVDRANAASHLAMLGGFEFDDEVTRVHIASPGVTGQYFGHSGELFADD